MQINASRVRWGAGIVVVVLALWWVYANRIPAAGGLDGTTLVTIPDPSALPGLQAGDAPWAPEIQNLAARLAANGIPQLAKEGTVLHTHQHLDIFINGRPIAVPAMIGINNSAGWLSPVHVHNTSGIIHIESPFRATFTLGQFFDIWGVKFTSAAIGGYTTDATHALRVYVNGELYQGDPRMLALAPRQEIAIVYGTDADIPETIPASYTFPAGY